MTSTPVETSRPLASSHTAGPAAPAAVAAVAPASPNAILAIALVSYFMIVLDASIVITGLPHIRAALGFSETGLSWVQNAYLLAFGGLLLLGARAGDLFGRRRMFLVGLAVSTLASGAIGAALSPAWMVVARAVQGAGAAVLAPATLALLTSTFAEGPARTRALGLYGATAGISASLGLVVGGLVADLLSWRAGFFINLPVGLALMLAAWRHVRGMPPERAAGGAPTAPLLPPYLFADRGRAGAYAARFFFLGGMMGFWFFMTQYLQDERGMSAIQAGAAYLPATLTNFAAAMAVPRLSTRFGLRAVLTTGLVLSVAGVAALGHLGAESGYWSAVALPMLLIGVGQGFALSPLTVAGVAGVAARDAGAASGVVNVAHQLGGSIGLAALVAVSSTAGTHDPGVHRFAIAFTAAAAMLAVALVTVLATQRRAGEG